MRRALLSTVALTAFTLTGPAAALAGRDHHHHHHQAKRRAHHSRVHFVHLGAALPGATGTPNPGVSPSTSPTTSPNENIGKVASYTGGVLTLTLNDNSSVSGTVTNRTRIECVSATAPPTDGPGEEGPGDDGGMGDDQNGGERNQGAPLSEGRSEDGQDGDDDQGEEGQTTTEPPCDSSALVPGALVRRAELRITPEGTEFESIEIVR